MRRHKGESGHGDESFDSSGSENADVDGANEQSALDGLELKWVKEEAKEGPSKS